MEATDKELSVSKVTNSVSIESDGSCLVDPAKLSQIIASVKNGDVVTIDSDDKSVTVRIGKGKFSLLHADPNEFPSMQDDCEGQSIELAPAVLKSAIHSVAFSASRKESSRWACTGVFFEFGKEQLILVATDTIQLAKARIPAVGSGKLTAIVPLKACSVLEKNLDTEGPVKVTLVGGEAGVRAVHFSVNGVKIHSLIVAGRFPPYHEVLPKKYAFKFQVTEDLADAVKAASIAADKESTRVDVNFDGQGSAVVSSSSVDIGKSEVSANVPDSPDMNIAFNPDLIGTYFKIVPLPGLALLNDSQKPIVIESQSLGFDHTYLLMTMSLT